MSSKLKNGLSGFLDAGHTGIICLLLVAGILIACLWPFNLHPSNNAEWTMNGNGMTFSDRSIVFSPGPLAIPETASMHGAVTIELYVQPRKESRDTVAYLLTLFDRDQEQFIIGQWITELIIRAQTETIDGHRLTHEIGFGNPLQNNTTHLITITSGKEMTRIYIDGHLAKGFLHFSLIPNAQKLSGQLVLGNSADGNHPWNGSLFRLVIHGRTLSSEEVLYQYHALQQEIKRKELPREAVTDRLPARRFAGQLTLSRTSPIAMYLFDERGGQLVRDHAGPGNDLVVPAIFAPLRRTVLGMPNKHFLFSRANLADIAINTAGFMPLGFFLSAWLRLAINLPAPRAHCIALLLGFCLSFAIELAQAYFPARDSSLMDVISNTLGIAAGMLLLNYVLPMLHKTNNCHTALQ